MSSVISRLLAKRCGKSNEVRLWLSERDCLQSGEPGATAGTAEENRQVVADQLAAATGEDGRQAGQARPVLLADAGREPPDAAVVREHGPADRSAGGGDRVAGGCVLQNSTKAKGGRRGVHETRC